MLAIAIGISSGVLVILLLSILKKLDKKPVYALVLTGIGFLYVGFTWTDRLSLIITSAQALFFLFFAYFGIKRNLLVLASGFFLHGLWDLGYDHMNLPALIPPHYDLFCLSIDLTIGFYILFLKYRDKKIVSDLKADITLQWQCNCYNILNQTLEIP